MVSRRSSVALLLALVGLAYSLPVAHHDHPPVPESAVCADSMEIGHQGIPQKSEFPYEIAPSKTNLAPGESTDIVIKGKTDADQFTGLLIQSRCGNEKAGSFVGSNLDANKVKFFDCGNGEKSVALFITMDKKAEKQAVFNWTAPKGKSNCSIDFYASVVKDYGTYWVKHKGGVPVTVSN